MSTFKYMNTTAHYTNVLGGITIPEAGVTYSEDNLTLNKYVPAYLDRYVDGVLSNVDVARPDPTPITAQEVADHNALHVAGGPLFRITGNSTAVGIIGVAATFVTLTAADSAVSTGFLQLSSAGVHGLTTGVGHAGKMLYVTWSGGTGVSGLYAIKSVDSTLIITLDTPSTGFAGMGTAVVSVVATKIPMITAAVAAGVLKATSKLVVDALWSHTSSANNKTLSLDFGGTTFGTYVTPTTVASTMYKKEIRNKTLATQISSALTSIGEGSETGAVVTGTVDTATAQNLVISGTIATANEVLQIETFNIKADIQ